MRVKLGSGGHITGFWGEGYLQVFGGDPKFCQGENLIGFTPAPFGYQLSYSPSSCYQLMSSSAMSFFFPLPFPPHESIKKWFPFLMIPKEDSTGLWAMSEKPPAISFKIYKTLNHESRALKHLIAKGDILIEHRPVALALIGFNRDPKHHSLQD